MSYHPTMDGCVYDYCSIQEGPLVEHLKRDGQQAQNVGPTRKNAKKQVMRRNTIKRQVWESSENRVRKRESEREEKGKELER